MNNTFVITACVFKHLCLNWLALKKCICICQQAKINSCRNLAMWGRGPPGLSGLQARWELILAGPASGGRLQCVVFSLCCFMPQCYLVLLFVGWSHKISPRTYRDTFPLPVSNSSQLHTSQFCEFRHSCGFQGPVTATRPFHFLSLLRPLPKGFYTSVYREKYN